MTALARWCFRHRAAVLALWLAAFIGFTAANQLAKANYSTKFQLPNTESARALSVLRSEFPAASGEADHIVVRSLHGTLAVPATRARITAMLGRVAALPGVRAVTSPYQVPGQVNRDGTVGFATVVLTGQSQDVKKSDVVKIISTARSAADAGIDVALGGTAIQNAQPVSTGNSTVYGVVLALVVLGFAFGALFSAILPLLTALVAIGIGYAITGLLTHLLSVPSFASELGILIGLGVGVDYALFILTRHRTGLRGGRSVEESAVNAANTAGRAVFFAGITVCIALLGQFALGVSFLYGVAIGASITVAFTMLAALTLLPALLGFVGDKALSRRERRHLAGEGPISEEVAGFWYRWSLSIERSPLLRAAIGLVIVVMVALPIFTLRLGLTDAGSDPTTSTTRQAYDLLAKGFGPGFNGPLQLVGQLDSPSDLPAFERIVATVEHEPGIVSGGRVLAVASRSGRVAVSNVYPTTGPQAAQTTSTLHELRNRVLPALEKGTGVTVLVAGSTAIQADFAHVLSSKLPLFVAVVVVLAFLLLMLVFRSLLIPAIASVMNLLSVGAALGLMNATFEWGWGRSLLGISRLGPVEVFIPVILFSVLFGLSMDYEVFLVSRMHEEWVLTGDNQKAVTRGQAETGRVITAAALIMVLVFASFVLGGSIIIKQFGVGLAGAIIIDAFVVRTLLVPALMHLLGRANWWLPASLDRVLPHVAVDAPDQGAAGTPSIVAGR